MNIKCTFITILVSCLFCFWVRCFCFFFFSSRRRHTRYIGDWSSDVCSSDLAVPKGLTTVCEPFWDGTGHEPATGHPQIVRGQPLLPNSALQEGITIDRLNLRRSEERRVGKEGRARWAACGGKEQTELSRQCT